MGIFILIYLIAITLAIGLTFLFYWIPKKLGYQKLGKIFATIIGVVFVTLTISIVFEDLLFFKKDATKLLEEQDIKLTDQFEIIENKSMSAIGEYYHTFSLRISQKDKSLLIEQIKSSPDFKGLNKKIEDITRSGNEYRGRKIIQNYEDSLQFVREYYKPNEENYAPTYRKIEIGKIENKLIFEDIDD
jgi:hypothetical protein